MGEWAGKEGERKVREIKGSGQERYRGRKERITKVEGDNTRL